MEIKTGNRKFRVSIFDIVVIILVILLALGFVYYKNHHGKGGAVFEQTYQIEFANIDESVQDMDLIHPGDKIIDKVKKYELGEVVSVEYVPYKQSVEDLADQKIVESEVPGKITANVTLRADCTDDGTKIATTSGFTLAVGTSMSVLGPGYSGSGYLISMDRSEN